MPPLMSVEGPFASIPPFPSYVRLSSKTGCKSGHYTRAAKHPDFAERVLRNIGPLDLLRLDVGGPDHLGPFLGIFGNELTEVDG
jgi:hypothetical protein